ncbi:MAG: DUF2877 domain-containing protein [Kiloniellales bacterium]
MTLDYSRGRGHARRDRVIAAFEIGCLAARALRPGLRGRLRAVFERSFYIHLAGQEICLGPPGLGAGPLNLRCRVARPDWPAWGLREGAAVLLGAREICIPPHLRFALAGAAVWRPPAPGAWSLSSLGAGLRALDARLPERVPAQGLGVLALAPARDAPVDAVAAAARGPVAALTRFLRRALARDPGLSTPIVPDLQALIGLGPGLTPSGDDLLGGALVAFHLLGRTDLRDALWKSLSAYADAECNAITRAHLGAAAQGLGGAGLHAVLNDLLTGTTEALPRRLAAIEAIGHTSGWDALAGAVLVLRARLGAAQPSATDGRARITGSPR